MPKRKYGFDKDKHAHHTLPVNANIRCLEWHLKNLDIGYLVIKEISKKEHIESHKRLRRKFYVYNKTLCYKVQ